MIGASVFGAPRASYTLTNAQFTDAGSYRLLAYNAAGAVVSDPTELIVRPKITRLAKIGDDIQLTFQGTPARNFAVLATTDFKAWNTVTIVSNATGVATATHTNAPPRFSFYRLEQLP